MADDDEDTDLSDSERVPAPPSQLEPPSLRLQPEAVFEEKTLPRRAKREAEFPDFLPPPFNSWSLSQLGALRHVHAPATPLERFLQRLVQLERRQVLTVLEEQRRRSAAQEVTPACHRTPAAIAAIAMSTTRLSSPKCILQCQRAFPLGLPPCRGAARPRPTRSCSESRGPAPDAEQRGLRLCSPARTNQHLRRMRASGNLRTPSQGATPRGPAHASLRNTKLGESNAGLRNVDVVNSSNRTGRSRRRSNSRRNSSSDGRLFHECEVKPDAKAAILDNLPPSKSLAPLRP